MEEQSKSLAIEEQEEELNKEKFSIFPPKVADALENIEKVFGGVLRCGRRNSRV